MARGRKRLSTAEQIEKTEAMVLQKKEELDELVAELKRLREIEKKENQAALLAAVAKSKWSFEQIMEFVQSKRKTSCVFSSDNPSFIMITYILLYFSCRTGSAFD